MSGSHRRVNAKRQKIELPKDSLQDEDLPTANSLANAPSSVAWSTRQLPSPHIMSLTSLCIRVFVTHFKVLSADGPSRESVKAWLIRIPETLVPRILSGLRETCPTFLSNEFISAYLLRGSTLALGDDLPGVGAKTISAIARLGSRELLREVDLRGLYKIPDKAFASVLANLPNLQALSLRECTKVGPQTVEAAANCPRLESVNFSYTAVTPISLVSIIRNCKELRVLKLAGAPNWTDANISKLWRALGVSANDDFRLPNIRTLKLRQTSVTDATLITFLTICPNIRRLDLSFTGIRHPPPLFANTSLEKLSLTSTQVSSSDVLKIVSGLTGLKKLSLGALGRGGGSATTVVNTTALTFRDDALRGLTNKLATFENLESINLAGNLNLGSITHGALFDFISRVGRKCKTLNLSGLSHLECKDLEGLLPVSDGKEFEPSLLEVLVLNNTPVGDSAAPYISCCSSLRILELGSTKFTRDGLFTILDGCRKLETLNLTSCRGLKIAERRNFFEVYDREHRSNERP
ncbi:hypothetical protein BDY19DRAFT_913980 [Irpex rosettiformis]|uniref:Uncharacterized protein n=1 Tax=Irpex rosettiformis TaxID=378272 RepID=A0ACB8UK79_9APHY|nr:hypothetical protein BDY19DRAFT_913980 [Irpex rosettiformis]